MVYLMNSNVMPNEGVYRCYKISKDRFIEEFKQAKRLGILKSYIGYSTTAKIIEEITNTKIELNRGNVILKNGDIMLVCKLKVRLDDAAKKSDKDYQKQLTQEDFEFYKIVFREELY